MNRILLLILLAAGCITAKPSGMGVWQPTNPEIAAPEGADEATYLILAEWARRSPPAPRFGWYTPRVRWFKGYESPTTGCCHLDYGPGRLRDSVTWPREASIHVVTVTPEQRPSGSGLAHELLHWALVASGRDGDNGHKGAIWQQVKDVNALLRERGL